MHDPKQALWFSLPDVVASKLLTGRTPKIVDAFRVKPQGILPGLETIKLRGVVDIDPRRQDFFKVVIEEPSEKLDRPVFRKAVPHYDGRSLRQPGHRPCQNLR
jgi:hypothetical protein